MTITVAAVFGLIIGIAVGAVIAGLVLMERPGGGMIKKTTMEGITKVSRGRLTTERQSREGE
jgi:hypothetical protein